MSLYITIGEASLYFEKDEPHNSLLYTTATTIFLEGVLPDIPPTIRCNSRNVSDQYLFDWAKRVGMYDILLKSDDRLIDYTKYNEDGPRANPISILHVEEIDRIISQYESANPKCKKKLPETTTHAKLAFPLDSYDWDYEFLLWFRVFIKLAYDTCTRPCVSIR